jgi:predicted transposase YbfD/YdcC
MRGPAAQWRRVLVRAWAAGNVHSIGIETCSMVAMARARIQEHFATLDDPRVERTRRHDSAEILVIAVLAVKRGVQLGQIATDEKSNEITAIPALLDTLDVRGATVTIDAEGCQKKIVEKIVDGGANYLLALKANHPRLASGGGHVLRARAAGPHHRRETARHSRDGRQGPRAAGNAKALEGSADNRDDRTSRIRA